MAHQLAEKKKFGTARTGDPAAASTARQPVSLRAEAQWRTAI
jgi:hypothetical protein